ncbi:unnamed protein product [Allacma fusca]|uniref:Uncharacterized protein n=1 Tax=Allacma fusca TaxID=39272 RepID=A0A8J2KFY6_9HEXA|nr:unnamed protein product [Allacma fusca]
MIVNFDPQQTRMIKYSRRDNSNVIKDNPKTTNSLESSELHILTNLQESSDSDRLLPAQDSLWQFADFSKTIDTLMSEFRNKVLEKNKNQNSIQRTQSSFLYYSLIAQET